MSVKRTRRRFYFIKKFPFIKRRSANRASLILVKDRFKECRTESEKTLYEKLYSQLYYPSPRIYIGGVQVNMALVPYRIAFIEVTTKDKEKRIIKQLKKKKWHVQFYDPTKIVDSKKCEEYLMNEARLQPQLQITEM
ncbi:hypothetical protein AB990_19180 [Alkalihalobacillus pseudalcaliphilus]|nr:hypothetical protein AB990_19180 [Alkalihalobacillus pseudalcaliphilus]